AAFTVVSSTSIRATVPAGATSGRITVTTPAGTATSASNFTVARPPTITGFSPTRGPGGTVVSIDGSEFAGASGGPFGGKSAGFSVLSSTRIQASVPSGARTGRITVTTPAGTATSAGDFTVVEPPDIQSFTPDKGPIGMVVVLDGEHFDG